MLKDFKYHITIPVILLLFGLSMALSYNIAKAWTNPASPPPTESLMPIAIINGGTAASSTSQARLNLGAAASGANSDITSLSPSGNLIISPTGGVGIGTTSLGTGALVTVNGNLVSNGELQSTLQTGDGQIRMIAGNYGAMWRNDGTNTWFLLTASGNQYGGWNSLRPMQINDSSGEVYMANGLDVTSGGITFPDGTVQTTAATNPATGTQTFATPGTYTWTVPSGVTRVIVYMWAGGQSGGAGSESSGGCSSAFTEGWLSVTPGGGISITVGAGGTGTQVNGGNSSVSFNTQNITVSTCNPTSVSANVIISFGGQPGGLNSNYATGGGGAPSITGCAVWNSMGYGANGNANCGMWQPSETLSASGWGIVPAGGTGGAAGTSSSYNGGAGGQPGGGGGDAYVSGYTPGPGGNGEVILQW